jgi:hypothetical protein
LWYHFHLERFLKFKSELQYAFNIVISSSSRDIFKIQKWIATCIQNIDNYETNVILTSVTCYIETNVILTRHGRPWACVGCSSVSGLHFLGAQKNILRGSKSINISVSSLIALSCITMVVWVSWMLGYIYNVFS